MKIIKMAKNDQKLTGSETIKNGSEHFSMFGLIHFSNENGHDLTKNSQILVKFRPPLVVIWIQG